MKNKIGVLCLAVAVMALGACGSSGTTATDIPTISDLAQLPKATSPMASTSTNLAAPLPSAQKDFAKANAATEGKNIRTTDSSAFSYLSSMGSCNTFNVLKEGFSSASQADMILCFISNMNDSFTTVTNPDGQQVVVDIYDGAYHIFNMNMVGDDGAPDRIKMKIVKTGGSITDFKMWMCKRSGDTLFQNEYTEQTISGQDVNMTALGLFSDGTNTGRHHVAVSGKLDAARVYTTKTITTKNWNTQTSTPSNWTETILTQTPAAFSFSGYNKGTSPDGGQYTDFSTGLGQMIGDTGALTALAMGDGAVKYNQTFVPAAGDTHTQNGTNGWNGDTTAPEAAADNDYYTTADALTYSTPVVQSSIDGSTWIAFSGAQVWDCTDDVGVGIYTLPETQYTTIAAQCSEYTFDHNWINCYEKIGNCNGDNICQNAEGSTKTACQACFTDGTARKPGTATNTCLTDINWPDVATICPAL